MKKGYDIEEGRRVRDGTEKTGRRIEQKNYQVMEEMKDSNQEAESKKISHKSMWTKCY